MALQPSLQFHRHTSDKRFWQPFSSNSNTQADTATATNKTGRQQARPASGAALSKHGEQGLELDYL